MTWRSFQQGSRCKKCYHESLRKNYTPEELNKFNKYRKYIISLSNRNYRKYKNIINPTNLERGRNKYHLDHIFSIAEGFKRNIPVKYLANPYNLQMLLEKDNIIKNSKIGQTEKALYKGYVKFKECLV